MDTGKFHCAETYLGACIKRLEFPRPERLCALGATGVQFWQVSPLKCSSVSMRWSPNDTALGGGFGEEPMVAWNLADASSYVVSATTD